METTPNDLRQQQFEIKFRGYNPDDVEVFRDLAATALEEARADILKLTEENNHLRERLEHLVSIEETLKAAVLEAQKNADNTLTTAKRQAEMIIDSARREADLILREARHKAEEMTLEGHQQMGKLVNDINKIRFIRSNYLSKLNTLLESQMQALREEVAGDEREAQETRKFESRQSQMRQPEPPPAPEPEPEPTPQPQPEREPQSPPPVRDEQVQKTERYSDEMTTAEDETPTEMLPGVEDTQEIYHREEEHPEERRDDTAPDSVLTDEEKEEMHDAIDRAFQEGPTMRPEERPSDERTPEPATEESGHERRHEDDDDTWKKLKEHLGED